MKIRIDNKIKLIKYKQSIKSSKSDLIFIKDESLIPYLSFVKKNKSVYKALELIRIYLKLMFILKKCIKMWFVQFLIDLKRMTKLKIIFLTFILVDWVQWFLLGVIIIVICRFKRWKSWLKDWFLMIENLTDNYKFIKIKTL